MRKLSAFCIICFFMLITVNFAGAQDVANKFGIGANVLYYFPQEDDLFGTSVNVDEDIALGLNFTYIVIPSFSLELAWNYFKTDIKNGSIKLGEITTMPLLLTAQFRIIPEGPIVPYVGAGVGYYLNDLAVKSEAKKQAKAANIAYPTDVDNSLGLHLNAGVDWFLTDFFALNLDTRYFFSEADIEGKGPTSGTSGEINLDSLVVGAGVKVFF